MLKFLDAHPKIKAALIYSSKNAVNALLTNGALMTMLPKVFNMHSSSGWWDIGKAALSAVLAREVTVWGPKLLAWSQSGGSEN